MDNQVSSAIANTPLGFDFDGNTTQYNNQTAYTFDVENRISGYGGTPVISYNPDGLRGVDGSSGSPVFYFYDGSRLLYEVNYGSGSTTAYGWGAAGLSQKAELSSGTVTQYAYDPQGSVVSDYDDYSQWYNLYFYDAFGQLREAYYVQNGYGSQDISTGDYFDKVGFGGQWGYYTDYPSFSAAYGHTSGGNLPPATSGQLLLGHRYYDPLLARFLSRDPIGYEGGINLYAYCGNNPIMGSDPSGLAEDFGGPDKTVRLTIAAFIPVASISGPLGESFAGDNRGYNPKGGTFRVQEQVSINTSTGVIITSRKTGTTKGLSGIAGGFIGQASIGGLEIGVKRFETGFEITFSSATGNPFYDQGLGLPEPTIKFDVTVRLDRQGNIISTSGEHTLYPALELYKYSNHGSPYMIYGYDPRSINANPVSGLVASRSFGGTKGHIRSHDNLTYSGLLFDLVAPVN